MSKFANKKNDPALSRVKQIEVSDKNRKPKLVAIVLLMALGVTLIAFAVTGFLTTSPGWETITANATAEESCAGEFVFLYLLGDDGKAANVQQREITAAYTQATKDAFQLYDQQPARNYPASTALMEGLERGELETVARNLYNALEEPVGGQKPLIFRVRDTLLEQGALGARMTGSGSAVFGIFTQEDQARQAAGQLRKLCRDVFVCRPLARKK